MFSYFLVSAFVLQLTILGPSFAADSISVSIPSSPPSTNVVQSNFFGVSFELSFMNQYFGNDTSSIPQAMLNYLSELRSRNGPNIPVRIRVGGNSADTSTYVATQNSPMLVLTDPNANSNNQPVDYGPMLWQVMNRVSQDVGGVEYLIGLTINEDNNSDAIIAGAAKTALGGNLDAILLGNEPDLYAAHNQRPNLQNYTVQNYIGEYSAAVNDLTNTSAGNLVAGQSVAGPTICCAWDLATVLQQGWLSTFSNVLKYITLQHYPQNNCFGSYQYQLPYYLEHANVVELAAWQKPGIDIIASNTSSAAPRMLMSEFNSASCGGIPGISDTFGVGTLWSIDYALQMASVGYTAAYIHTREQGISYNLVTPPSLSDLDSGSWTTEPPFYAVMATAEILGTASGGFVADLDVGGSKTNEKLTYAGYAVYDSTNSSVTRVALFNFGNSTMEFALPGGLKATSSKNALVKYLSAASINEKTNIAWGERTFLGSTNGTSVAANTSNGWAYPNQNVDCSNGCNLTVPGPSLAVVFLDELSSNNSSSNNSSSSTNTDSNDALRHYDWTLLSSVLLTLYVLAASASFTF